MNKVILMGRLSRDPITRYSQGENQTAVARGNLAVNRRYKRNGEAEADFINLVAFGKQAEFFEKYLKQGSKICVVGRIMTGSYTKDGQKIYTTEVVVEEVEFAESKKVAEANNSTDMERPAPIDMDGFMNIPDELDGLPFN